MTTTIIITAVFIIVLDVFKSIRISRLKKERDKAQLEAERYKTDLDWCEQRLIKAKEAHKTCIESRQKDAEVHDAQVKGYKGKIQQLKNEIKQLKKIKS